MTITITMPDDVVSDVDEAAERQNRTRSNMIATAVKEWLKEHQEERQDDK